MKIPMNTSIHSIIGRGIFVVMLYLIHLGAFYTIFLYFRMKNIYINIGFVISVLFLCFSGIIGWLMAADDSREAFVRFKKTDADKEPSSEFTVFAQLRFVFTVILWPYLSLFGNSETE